MARIARVIVPGLSHRATQRGNLRQVTFLFDDDYHAYHSLMAAWCGKYHGQIWAYCLMPNHVQLIAIPGMKRLLRPGKRGPKPQVT